MPAVRISLTAASLCLAATITISAEKTDKKPPADFASVQRLPDDVTLATLANGLTVIVQENRVAPVATVRCFVKNTGSAFEGKHLGAGISHVLEHVVAGGTTTKRSEDEIQRIINTFGGATNAFTSTDMTSYFIDCPAKKVLEAVDLMADAMQHVKFVPDEFERELKVVRRELADGEVDRHQVQWKLLSQLVYTEHPARHPIIGYLDALNATKNETITGFYRERYVPNNQVLVVAGDVDAKKVLDRAAREWAGTPRGYETYVPLPDEPEQLSPRESATEMDGKTYDVALAWPTVRLTDHDMYALDVAAYILTQGESARLTRKLKFDRQLALSVEASSYTPWFVRGFFAVSASCTPESWRQAADEILAEIARLREQLVDSKELAKAKKQKAAELVFERQSIKNAAQNLGQNYLGTGDPLFDRAYVAGIQKVTADDIRRVARRYLVPERLNRVVIAPPGGLPKATEKTAAAAQSDVQLHRLANGLRVLVKSHRHLPLVNIQAHVLAGGLVDTEETAGRSHLLAEMLERGTTSYTAEEIADYFDSIGGQINFSAGRFTIGGSATFLSDDLSDAVARFAECVTSPKLPADEFAKVQRLALGEIARRGDNPHAEIMEVFADSLPPQTPFHLNSGGKAETVKRLRPQDLRVLYQRCFVPQNMVVAVFGDIDPKQALALAEKHFGSMKPAGSSHPLSFDRDNTIEKSVVRHKQVAKETGMVMLGYTGPSVRQTEDYAAMTLLDAIVSGYSYPGGWLHNELRGAGLVYFVHAFPITGPVPGYFGVLAQTQPEKIEDVVQRIRRNIAKVKEGKVSPDEFREAVQMVTALHAQENTTIAEQAREAAIDELYGLGYNYGKSFDARIAAVKLEDIGRVAKKYLGNSVLTTLSPEKK